MLMPRRSRYVSFSKATTCPLVSYAISGATARQGAFKREILLSTRAIALRRFIVPSLIFGKRAFNKFAQIAAILPRPFSVAGDEAGT